MSKEKIEYTNNMFNLQSKLQNHMKNLRVQARRKKNCFIDSEIIKSEYRDYYENNEKKKRVVVFLKGSGCSRVESVGGCTFCGFYNATNKGIRIADDDYLSQMRAIIANWDKNISKVCCYNDGSLLCDREISFDTVLEIFRLLNEHKYITSITIEAKIEDINEKNLPR